MANRKDPNKEKGIPLPVIIGGIFCPLVFVVYFLKRYGNDFSETAISFGQNMPEIPHTTETPKPTSDFIFTPVELPEKEFYFKDTKGNICKSGGYFHDWAGNYVKWGECFTDHKGYLVEWGKPFYDNRNYYVGWGNPFYDADDNYIAP